MCWFCHWGLPKPVADIYLGALKKLHGDSIPLLYGPAHIVWEDCNFDSAQWCLDHFDEYNNELSDEQKEIVRQSLLELIKLPESTYDFDGMESDDNYENQPPPKDWVMVTV